MLKSKCNELECNFFIYIFKYQYIEEICADEQIKENVTNTQHSYL